MNPFENILKMAAKSAMNAFRGSGQYFYEDRKTGSRLQINCIERTIEIHESDDNNITFIRTGKGFLISDADRDAVDAWRKERQQTADGRQQQEPTPAGTDYIVKVAGEQTEHYEISSREPFSLIGNGALVRINTVFVKKERDG